MSRFQSMSQCSSKSLSSTLTKSHHISTRRKAKGYPYPYTIMMRLKVTKDRTQNNDDGHGRAMFDEYIADPTKFNDLTGKIVAITGTSVASIGFHIAEVAIKKNAKMVLCLNRDSQSAKQGEDGLKEIVLLADNSFGNSSSTTTTTTTIVQTVLCDLQDLASVKRAGEEVNKIVQRHGGLDVLVLNAGIMATRDTRTFPDGFEIQMQTNHLSHFLLTQQIWPSIQLAADHRGEARVVTHSSSARRVGSMLKEKFFSKSKPNTLGGDKTWMASELFMGKEGPWQRYHQTKLANAVFAMELHNRLVQSTNNGNKIKALTADPGVAWSNLHTTAASSKDGLMAPWAAKVCAGMGHSAENGALPAAMAAFSPQANSGDMFVPHKGGRMGYPVKCIEGGKPVKRKGEKLTCHPENQQNVWAFSEKALNIEFNVVVQDHAHYDAPPEAAAESSSSCAEF